MSPIPSPSHALLVGMSDVASTISSLRVAMPNTVEMGPWQRARFTVIITLSAFLVFAALSTIRMRPSSLSLAIVATTYTVQHLKLQPIPALEFYLIAIEAVFLAVFTPFTVNDDKDYKSYGSNLATAILWGLMTINRAYLGLVWPYLFGFFFDFVWPLSFIVELGMLVSDKPLSKTAVFAAAVISITMARIFQFGMDITYWATWPITFLSLHWAFPNDAPIAWNILGMVLLTIMGLAIDITHSPMTFQVFALSVSTVILVKEAFLNVFRYRESHSETYRLVWKL